VVERQVDFLGWVSHLQNAYFEQHGIPKWTLADDGQEPPNYPNAYKNPWAQVTLTVPSAPTLDPKRGLKSKRHKPWSDENKGSIYFEWVDPGASLQWHAFQRVIGILQKRGNEVLVLVGPFNEHIMAAENQAAYRKIHARLLAWFSDHQIPYVAPEPLPSALYADDSHPLTEGYALLAKQLHENKNFQQWLKTHAFF
jgi:hypothetical protein